MTGTDQSRSERGRWIALVVVCMAQLMSIMDGTIVTVALSTMVDELHATLALTAWTLTGYALIQTIVLPLSGIARVIRRCFAETRTSPATR